MPGHRKRRQFKQTDAFTRGMVMTEKGRNAGATRVTSARVDRRILRQAVAAPQATCTAILQHVQDTLDHFISTRTISCRLVANGLHSCRPLRRLPLTPPNRRQRLEWCRARSTWMTEWHRVVFSDESRFCLSSDSRRVRVWRRRGERSNPAAIVERPTVRLRGIMVWGAIAYDSRSPLLRIQGTMTAQRYVDDVLRPVTLPYLQGVLNALYQQGNARPHTARISQQALQDVQMLPWPPYSPDLSPIEHVWDIIGRRLHVLPQPRSEDELWQMVEREWRAIPQDAIRTLIDSLPRGVAACIAIAWALVVGVVSCSSYPQRSYYTRGDSNHLDRRRSANYGPTGEHRNVYSGRRSQEYGRRGYVVPRQVYAEPRHGGGYKQQHDGGYKDQRDGIYRDEAPQRRYERPHVQPRTSGRAYGRSTQFTMGGPSEKGQMKVVETHVTMDREMKGPEAANAMEKIMGSMGDSKADFQKFVSELGFGHFP
ncbi:hypothetical protein LAZ67_13001148 [Cordylochernes scorpioides]|uniref:Transposable element Tc1 transposase n=1 Tax=Cordylochernes scorpioides TaxID=51811 RepID=A0ABY6L4E9_9ARAC|nr:hypothetical protein LAZ67_13001148 [Cordylochernes scorpioides]